MKDRNLLGTSYSSLLGLRRYPEEAAATFNPMFGASDLNNRRNSELIYFKNKDNRE
jgi:hypothetical protein